MITINNTADLQAASMTELVEFYNHNADKPVSRFSDRKAAERRVAKLVEENTGKQLEAPEASPEEKADETKRSQAEGITASWTDPKVREARSSRIHITVDGEEFSSVRKAFLEFALPLNEHIIFRGNLREAGELESYGKKWVVTEVVGPKAK
jgi:hypothetical protein